MAHVNESIFVHITDTTCQVELSDNLSPFTATTAIAQLLYGLLDINDIDKNSPMHVIMGLKQAMHDIETLASHTYDDTIDHCKFLEMAQAHNVDLSDFDDTYCIELNDQGGRVQTSLTGASILFICAMLFNNALRTMDKETIIMFVVRLVMAMCQGMTENMIFGQLVAKLSDDNR